MKATENVFNGLTQEFKTKKAIELVLLDAIKNSQLKATAADLAAYMATASFEKQVKGYLALMNN